MAEDATSETRETVATSGSPSAFACWRCPRSSSHLSHQSRGTGIAQLPDRAGRYLLITLRRRRFALTVAVGSHPKSVRRPCWRRRADRPRCQRLCRPCIYCSDCDGLGRHHLLPIGDCWALVLGLCILRCNPPPTVPEATGPLWVGQWPVTMPANTGSHRPSAMSSTVEVAPPQWSPASDPVAVAAQPPMRRSPRQRPSRAAPDRPASRQGTRTEPSHLISPRP